VGQTPPYLRWRSRTVVPSVEDGIDVGVPLVRGHWSDDHVEVLRSRLTAAFRLQSVEIHSDDSSDYVHFFGLRLDPNVDWDLESFGEYADGIVQGVNADVSSPGGWSIGDEIAAQARAFLREGS
jgi:hypothetical protein